MHKEVIVKALLDSGATGMFIDKKFAEERGFKMEKLERPLEVKNMDRSNNNGGQIEHKVKCNMYFKGHMCKAKAVKTWS